MLCRTQATACMSSCSESRKRPAWLGSSFRSALHQAITGRDYATTRVCMLAGTARCFSAKCGGQSASPGTRGSQSHQSQAVR